MKRAIVIAPSNFVNPLPIPDGPHAELSVLQAAVGGYLELVPHSIPNFTVFCDEHGKMKKKKYNELATTIFGPPGDMIVGPIVVLGPVDEDGDTLGLTDKQVAIFLSPSGRDILTALAELNR